MRIIERLLEKTRDAEETRNGDRSTRVEAGRMRMPTVWLLSAILGDLVRKQYSMAFCIREKSKRKVLQMNSKALKSNQKQLDMRAMEPFEDILL